MGVQVTLTIAELERLSMNTAMKNPFEQRKKAAAAAKKRAAAGPVAIKSPRTQTRENQDRARQVAEAERARIERQRQSAAADAEARRIAQQEAAQNLRNAQAALAPEEGGSSSEAPRPRPKVQRGPAPSTPSAPVTRLATPEFVPPVTVTRIAAAFEGMEPQNVDTVNDFVRANREVAVLCAMNDGGGVRTWNSLRAPPDDYEHSPEWNEWLNPIKWVDLVRLIVPDNVGALKPVAQPGNYNSVLEPTVATPVNDPARWPPQLQRLGVDLEGLALTDVLPDASYVLRVTRTDPFPMEAGQTGELIYRSMKIDELVTEMSLTLHAASQGIGPPVYAAVSWPWAPQPGDGGKQRYGLVMILARADGDMVHYQMALRTQYPVVSALAGPPQELRENAELASVWLAGLCYHIAWTGHVNFDMKPGNLLMHHEQNTFFMSDFDAMYYRHFSDAAVGVRARFFINLLLLCMHVRAYSTGFFATPFLAPLAQVMLELWKQAVTDPSGFGAGAVMLQTVSIESTYDRGSFDHRELRRIADPAQRAGRQLSMMVFEYLFDNAHGKKPVTKVTQWPAWKKTGTFVTGTPPLIPQLLQFIFFYAKPIPDAYVEVLR